MEFHYRARQQLGPHNLQLHQQRLRYQETAGALNKSHYRAIIHQQKINLQLLTHPQLHMKVIWDFDNLRNSLMALVRRCSRASSTVHWRLLWMHNTSFSTGYLNVIEITFPQAYSAVSVMYVAAHSVILNHARCISSAQLRAIMTGFQVRQLHYTHCQQRRR
jgi:hypothetical protein